MLVRGLLTSFQTLSYATVLMFLFLYVFSILGVELIAKPVLIDGVGSEDYRDHVLTHFYSLPMVMSTLSSFIFKGTSYYTPILEEQPLQALYFIPVMLILFVG